MLREQTLSHPNASSQDADADEWGGTLVVEKKNGNEGEREEQYENISN